MRIWMDKEDEFNRKQCKYEIIKMDLENKRNKALISKINDAHYLQKHMWKLN